MHALSIASFHTLPQKEVQEQALLALYARGMALSDREAADILGWERGNVSARRNGLLKRGLVSELGQQVDPSTRKKVAKWGLQKDTLF
jgi:hypothetical protein